jgi:hypothetical protein
MSIDSERYVCLKDGRAFRQEAVVLLLDLETRGFKVWRDRTDIVVSPFSKLTDEDKRQLKLWRQDVLSLLDHIPTVEAQ